MNKEIISSESKRTDINFEENTNMEDFDLNVVPKQQTEKDIFLQPENTRNFQENKNEKKKQKTCTKSFKDTGIGKHNMKKTLGQLF